MCGICGFNFENKKLLKEMCDLIYHRGPDDYGYFTDTDLSIGMRRLSIIDLKTGQQPQHNEDEDIWIVFNGEIYNFLELRETLEKKGHIFYTNSDTEVIIHSYENWGLECFNKLRGQFALCLYDSINNTLILARDPVGLKPLYYYFDGNKFVFASEIKCLLLHDLEKKIDLNALNLYLSLKYVPFNLTLFQNIYKLPAGSYLLFNIQKKQISVKKYLDFKFNINLNKTEDILAKELRNLLEESVKIRLTSDVPLGAFLSGGLDSSIIVGLMSNLIDEPVKTFSVGFEKYAPVDELKYAKLVAEHFNTDHTEIIAKSTSYEVLPDIVWHFDDLIADPAVIPVYIMSKYAKKNLTVALTGDGSDEIFSGYAEKYFLNKKNYFRIIPKEFFKFFMRFYNYLPSLKLKYILAAINNSILEEGRIFRGIICVNDTFKNSIISFKSNNVQNQLNNYLLSDLDKINQYLNLDLTIQLPNYFNMKTDKMSMAASLETRLPYLDVEVVKWALTVPSSMKFKNDIEKYILRLAMKDLLPTEILKRKKLGFGTPVNLWLKTGMKEVSMEILERLMNRKEIISSEFIKKLIRNRKSAFFQNIIWQLILLELWYETFLENDHFKPIKL